MNQTEVEPRAELAGTQELYGEPFRLFRDMIAVEPTKENTKSEGGVELPDTAQIPHTEGKVVAYGPETTVQLDNIIVFSAYSGVDYEFKRKKLILVRERDLLAARV